MQEDIYRIAQNFSVEAVVIGAIVFALTMLIKRPIKKKSALLGEEKRKAVNSLIVLIPIVTAFVLTVCYYGFAKKEWLSVASLKTAASAWLLSFSFYAIFSRLVIIVKGIASGKIQITPQDVQTVMDKALNSVGQDGADEKAEAPAPAKEEELAAVAEQIALTAKVLSRLQSANDGKDVAQIARINARLYALSARQQELTGNDGKTNAANKA